MTDTVNKKIDSIDKAITALQRHSAEKELLTQLLETVMLASPDPIYTLDLDGRFMFANKATEAIFELEGEEIIGKNAFDSTQSFVADLKKYSQQVIDTRDSTRCEFPPLFSSRHRQVFECLLYPVFDGDENIKAIVSIWHDITERKIEEEKSWQDANYDALTGLPNRQLLLDRLKQEFNNASRSTLPLAVLFIDIDGFKDVNNSLGHQAGDSLLRSVAERLNFCVRKNDIVARIGADEFAVVLTNLQEGVDVSAFAHKIIDVLAEPFHVNESNVITSCSIGIALYHQDSDTPEDLLKRADHAMYAAKEAGHNQVCFLGPNSVLKSGMATAQVEH